MAATQIAWIAAILLVYALVSRRLSSTPVTAPMVVVGVGILLGPQGVGLLQLNFEAGVLHVLAEATLALVLFGDATRINLKLLRREIGLPARLLGYGLPLSIACGTVAAKLLLPLSWWEAATLGAVLAPTDAALSQAVVASHLVPVRMRQALNVESGLNDGLALPFVLIFASLAAAGEGDAPSLQRWLTLAPAQVAAGALVGVGTAWIGGLLIHRSMQYGWMEETFVGLAGPTLALLCFALAQVIGGNGFIAAFVGGMTLGSTERHRCRSMLGFLETEGELLMLLVFLGLGAGLLPRAIHVLDAPVAAYVVLSLTLVRMAPVSLSLVGSGLRPESHFFLGWFGPRGLASLIYALNLQSDVGIQNRGLLLDVTIVVAAASVFVHGLSAVPGARWYGRVVHARYAGAPEHRRVEEHALRHAR